MLKLILEEFDLTMENILHATLTHLEGRQHGDIMKSDLIET